MFDPYFWKCLRYDDPFLRRRALRELGELSPFSFGGGAQLVELAAPHVWVVKCKITKDELRKFVYTIPFISIPYLHYILLIYVHWGMYDIRSEDGVFYAKLGQFYMLV